MNLLAEQLNFNLDVVKLLNWCHGSGYGFLIKDCLRTIEEERENFIKGLSKCQPQNSYHVKGLAIDICFFNSSGGWISKPKELKIIGDFWAKLHPGNVWGGSWKFVDVMHFERRVI